MMTNGMMSAIKHWYTLCFILSIASFVMFLTILIAIAPGLAWLLQDVPYTFPKWSIIGRWAFGALANGFICGTMIWFVSRRGSHR
jgi:hypothetical protein